MQRVRLLACVQSRQAARCKPCPNYLELTKGSQGAAQRASQQANRVAEMLQPGMRGDTMGTRSVSQVHDYTNA
eukprot:9490720-Pyramimonas_sp.AAC.2